MKINSISFQAGYPTVRFSYEVAEGQFQDAVFPGKGSDDVTPRPSFESAVDAFVRALSAAELPDGYDWRIKNLRLLWNDEGTECGYDVTLTAFVQVASINLEFKIKQSSPDSIDPGVERTLKVLMEQSCLFASGKAAQTNLFDEIEDAA